MWEEKMANFQIMYGFWHMELSIWWNPMFTVQHGLVGLGQVRTRVVGLQDQFPQAV